MTEFVKKQSYAPKNYLKVYTARIFDEMYEKAFSLISEKYFIPVEIWRYIYTLSNPYFSKGDVVETVGIFILGGNAKIVNAYLTSLNVWIYSLSNDRALVEYVFEKNLRKAKDV